MRDKIPLRNGKDVKNFVILVLKYFMAGASNTVVYLLVYYLVITINSELYMLGNVLGWLIAIGNAFFWNHKFVFPSTREGRPPKVKQRLVRTYIMYAFTFGVYTVLLYLLVNVFHISQTFAPVILMSITIPLNFIISFLWSYKE